MGLFVADFETTTDEKDCRVWAYAICDIDNTSRVVTGNSIDSFFKWCEENHNPTIYFHNLKFDGNFIISYLLSHGYTYVDKKEDRADFTFSTLITDMGQFYSIEVYFKVTGRRSVRVKFLDSLKIFPNFSVERIAEGFNFPLSKLELDYAKYREPGHILTKYEERYIKHDVIIVAKALKIMFEQNLKKMTIASDALEYYKSTISNFRKYFPKLDKEQDALIRMSYRGGFTYLNPVWKEKITGDGMVLDKNSMYPSKMRYELMPFGEPEQFEGKYQEDKSYPLYVQQFTCAFKLKPGKIPTIQLKKSLSFNPTEYIIESIEPQTLTLTSVDLELFLENYDTTDIIYQGGFKFKAITGLFSDYIDHWIAEKIKASKEKNAPLRQIAKLLLNSLYGRFGLSPQAGKKMPTLKDGVVKYLNLPEEDREPVYIPVACFITAYARADIIRSCEKIRDFTFKKYGEDRYCYSDTDSIHALINQEDLEELAKDMLIDDYELGAWAYEKSFNRAFFIRQKCYIEETDGETSVTMAGCPQYLAKLLNFDNFRVGFTTEGMTIDDMIRLARKNGATEKDIKKLHHKLRYKLVEGGVVLVDTPFTIKK